MCVVAIAWRAHPRWRLLVAGNRDELHSRASQPLAQWGDCEGIIAGRDLVSGGTWMGISANGRFAVVTNIRDADGPDPQKTSRGALVVNWLRAASLPDAVDSYSPFNLFAIDTRSAHFVSNRPEPTSGQIEPGIHGLSNAISNEHWPRKDRLVEQMSGWLAGPTEDMQQLFELLGDETTADRDAYPVFIRSPVYGTRCSTLVAIDADGHGVIMERRFDTGGEVTGQTSIDFVWPI